MAIGSGTVSMSDIRTEWGRSGAISLSEMYRGGSHVLDNAADNTATNLAASVPTSGVVSIDDFRGTAKGMRKTFSADATDQSASTIFGDDYDLDYPKEIVIDSGVELGATSTSEEALEVESGLAGTLTITNNGTLTGAGGAAGADGGDAFEAASACTFINNGTIRAGGGGGGTGGAGGDGNYQSTTSASHANGIQNNTSYGNRGGYTNGNQTSFNVYGPSDGNIYQTFSGTITFAASVTTSKTSANVVNATYDYSRFNGSNSGGSYSAGTYTINGSTAYSNVRFYWTFTTTGLVTYNFGSRSAYSYTTTTTVNTNGGSGGSGGVGQGYSQSAGSGSSGTAGGTNAGTGGTGGAGGSFGSSGSSGNSGANGNSTNGSSGSGGGAAGKYIRGISNVTLTQNGTVQGGTA